MLSRTAARTVRPIAMSNRTFATSFARMAGNEPANPEAVKERGAADENVYIKQQEALKLQQLRKKLQDASLHIEELHKDVAKMIEEEAKKGESSK